MACKNCKEEVYHNDLCKEHYCEAFEAKIKSVIDKYGLISKDDKLLVAASGGKDSTVAQEVLLRLGYSFQSFMINLELGTYSKKHIENQKKYCESRGIKFKMFDLRDFTGAGIAYMNNVLKKSENLKACTVCGVMKRYFMNKLAKDLHGTKVITGHNLDDESQAALMNLLKGSPLINARSKPFVGNISDDRFVQRVKPLFFSTEVDITAYAKARDLPIYYERCPCASDAFRKVVRELFEVEEKTNSSLKQNIVKAMFEVQPKLQATKIEGEIGSCEKCGGASSSEVCVACQLMIKFNEAEAMQSKC